tara:strand:- start:730 stop:1749 length:1020 start_codon:yes stop_codon:yes gene_type:complete
MLLSICIPTFNRSEKLDNCLNSILISKEQYTENDFEICIADNNSNDNTKEIVDKYKSFLNINYYKNSENLGFARNAKKVIGLAKGKYSWLIGDDDLILPTTLKSLLKILKSNSDIELFFINSYYLNSEYLEKFPKPFNTQNIKLNELDSISKVKSNKIVSFWNLIDPEVSWEFLIGIFLTVFKTSKWIESSKKVDVKKLEEKRIWSNFENTCFHPIVNAYAFKNSKAFICAEPLSVNIIGFREWKSYYELIEIVRLPELIDFYKKEGLPLIKYLYCKNFALRNFFSYFLKIIFSSQTKGKEYLNLKKHFVKNLFFPNVYLSILTFIFRKLKIYTKKLFR